jgi:hypothetical protein
MVFFYNGTVWDYGRCNRFSAGATMSVKADWPDANLPDA